MDTKINFISYSLEKSETLIVIPDHTFSSIINGLKEKWNLQTYVVTLAWHEKIMDESSMETPKSVSDFYTRGGLDLARENFFIR